MSNILDALAQIIADKNNSWTTRMGFVFLIAILALLLNDWMGFTYHYRMCNKIDDLTRINKIIQNPLSDSTTKAAAIALRQDVVNRKGLVIYFLGGISLSPARTIANNSKQKSTSGDTINSILFFITASGLIIAFGILMSGVSYYRSTKGTFNLKSLAITVYLIIIYSIVGIILALCDAWIWTKCMIGGNWAFNYGLNIIIQIGVLAAILHFNNFYTTWKAGRAAKKLNKLASPSPTGNP